jgi:hypothetical protein
MWTYTDDPENVLLDKVRLLIGDTVKEDSQLSDNALNSFLADNEDDPIASAADAASALAARYARLAAEKTGDLAQQLTQKSKNYLMIAQDLRARIKTSEEDIGASEPWCGASSREPMFYRGVGYSTRNTTDYSSR